MTTEYLFDDLTRDEGLKLKAYRDSRGKWTIGIGHLISDDPTLNPQLSHLISVGITEAEAKALFASDVEKAGHELDLHLPWWRQLDDVRQDALLNMTFNMGVGELLTWHHTLAAIQAGDYAKAGAMIKETQPWATQVGARAQRISSEMASGTRAGSYQ